MRTFRTGIVRTAFAVACAGAVLLMAAGHGAAQSGALAVSDATLLTSDDSTSTMSATLTLRGFDGAAIVYPILDRGADPDCVPGGLPVLQPGVAEEVTFVFPAGCGVSGEVDVQLVATSLDGGESATNEFVVDVDDAPSDTANFAFLLWFVAAAAFSAIAVLFASVVPDDTYWNTGTDRWFGRILPGLTASWKLGDSWASNVTVAAAVFTGLFGAADVLESILGEDHDSQVAIAVVAAALTAGLVGAAPIVLAVLRGPDENVPAPGTALPINYTTAGVVAATWLVLTANLGLVSTMVASISDSESVSGPWLLGTALAASALLTAYTVRSMRRTLQEGVRPPVDDAAAGDDAAFAAAGATPVVRAARPTAAMP